MWEENFFSSFIPPLLLGASKYINSLAPHSININPDTCSLLPSLVFPLH